MSGVQRINLGCGTRFHPDWVNIDSVTQGDRVIKYDLRKGIPFQSSSFDVVYHSHVLEHFDKAAGHQFTQECYRVLKPQGVIRVVVPDLEQITHAYLLALEKSLSETSDWSANYDWILLELFDQIARNTSGGAMLEYLSNPNIPNLDFIQSRIGSEANHILEDLYKNQDRKDRENSLSQIKKIFKPLYLFLVSPSFRQDLWFKLILGREFYNLEIGRARQSGEIHYWMYDRYSLTQLLGQCGFVNIVQRQANESYIPNWSTFNLDTEPNGSVCKPDSLFIEAVKDSL